MKKKKLNKEIKAQQKLVKKQKKVIKSYKKLLEDYEKMNKQLKKNIKNLGNLIEDVVIEEELSEQEIDAFIKEFDQNNEAISLETEEEENTEN